MIQQRKQGDQHHHSSDLRRKIKPLGIVSADWSFPLNQRWRLARLWCPLQILPNNLCRFAPLTFAILMIDCRAHLKRGLEKSPRVILVSERDPRQRSWAATLDKLLTACPDIQEVTTEILD
jgi:hypothetical protein